MHRRPRAARAALAALTTLTLAALPGAAAADTAGTLTVVGTSDVQDSGLVPNLIKPQFEKAYPQFTFNYVSLGTGAAINYAKAGTASALIVHAASLENQFVAGGYSLEPYGRAAFWGDYVLLGPKSDPAGVLTGAPHDIAGAFERIAQAGAAGKADFVSRANTSGTAVQEHLIWALANPAVAGKLCPVSQASGGGAAPSGDPACPATASYPSWYHATGLTQGPNIENANTCNDANAGGGAAPDCYVFTDRGTYDCLISAACAGASAQPGNLQIVARDNAASARGGATELVNSFHAYAINPNAFPAGSATQSGINVTAARDFLDFLTSPGFQAQLKSYLGGTDGAPFIADASPALAASALPARVVGGRPVTVTGTVRNVVPGTPPLTGAPVTISRVAGGLAAGVPVASTNTRADGSFTLTFTPPASGGYQLSTGQVNQVEIASLSPAFGDILEPASGLVTPIAVQAVVARPTVRAIPGGVVATGSVLPAGGHRAGIVTLLGRGPGGRLRTLATEPLGVAGGRYALYATVPAGVRSVTVRFADPGQVLTATSRAARLPRPFAPVAGIALRRLAIAGSRVTVTAVLARAAARPLRAALVGYAAGPASGGSGPDVLRRRVLATVRISAGSRTATVRARLGAHLRWVLAVEAGGRASRLATVTVR